eukprot:GHUV01012227.1.p1 GENE.GHUV01012227.1~~GHUV01012227.1.p1  ORF type:complete len:637 (+),score=223.38 GHUV01012227.1:909-2819(+)
MAAAVTDLLNDKQITQLKTQEEHDMFIQQQPKLAKVLLFTDKNATTVLYKGLSWAYAKRLTFAQVHAAESSKMVEQYGVNKYPTLLVVKPGSTHDPYIGPLNAEPLHEFLDTYASDAAPSAAETAAAGGAEGLLEPVLHSLVADNLTEINSNNDMWLVAFYSAQGESNCQAQLEELQKILHEVQGIVNYGSYNAADLSAHEMKQYKLDTAAFSEDGCKLQLVLFPWGVNKTMKDQYMRWTHGLDNAKKLQDWILDKVPDFTLELTDEADGQSFIAATGAQLPPAAINTAAERRGQVGKVFLFSTKYEVPGIYKALAMHFHGKSRLLFGWTTPDTKGPGYPLMQKMNIRKAPAMSILFPLPPKPVGDHEMADIEGSKGEMAMQQYLGPLKYQKMLMWVQAMAQVTGMAYKSHAGSQPPPTPNDFEIRTQAQLKESCYDKPSLCMIVMIDGRSDMVNKYKDITKKAALALQGNPLTWVVVDVSQQRDFRSAYGLTADQLPTVVALSTRRMRFAQGTPPFTVDNIKQLVTKVLAGSAVTLPLPVLPWIVDGGQPGEEETAAAAADEFDLKDVMSEEVTAPITSKEEQLQKVEKELAEEARRKTTETKKGKKKSIKKTSKKKSSKKTKKKSTSSQPRDEL